jgi:PAS domain S-box-containing protein
MMARLERFFTFLKRVKGISLKWKLLIPFLFLAFIGTSALTYIGLTSQQKLIREEEKKGLNLYYQRFLELVKDKGEQAKSLAAVIAENRQVQVDLAEKNRQALIDLLMPIYVELKMDFDIEQLHLHLPGAVSFLRLHYLEKYGEDMSGYRKTIMDALREGRPVAGLEWGATGFGIRGVAPVFLFGKIVGTVEIGQGFGKDLLALVYKKWGVDLALYEVSGNRTFKLMARVGKEIEGLDSRPYLAKAVKGEPVILVAPERFPTRSILFGSVRDYSGRPVAMLELGMDRSAIQERLVETRNLMMLIGAAGLAVSFLLTYLVTVFFIKPIKQIVREAQDIAQEKRDSRLEQGPGDEIGTLTESLNVMLDSLKEKRVAIENYAKTLAKRVDERTADLVSSEEKYRTLVENVPLIVYRVLDDGTTEFINSYLTECLGYEIEDAVGNKRFWPERICGLRVLDDPACCITSFQTGDESMVERTVKDKEGKPVTFIDHAIPAKDGQGRVKWVDGIMVDISELKRLQDRELRAEEMRILGEISAHMAHEIRNPLIAVGGFARRLGDSLKEDDPNKKTAEIIVKEVARLENFLRSLLSSIRPFDLSLEEVSVNELLSGWVDALQDFLDRRHRRVTASLQPDLPTIHADKERLDQALGSLLKHAIVSMPEEERLSLTTSQSGDRVVITITHRVHHLSEDDLDKFFFPHIEEEVSWEILDLPLSKIIIHRHGGKVDLIREGKNVVTLRIELPLRFGA